MSIDTDELDANIKELVFQLIHSDRINDDMIPKGMIESSIENGDITINYIVLKFQSELEDYLSIKENID